MPHAPQFEGSICVSTHFPPQFTVPPRHCEAHVPLEQTSPLAHAFAHAPQFAGSICVSTHFPPQSVVPPAQLEAQVPFEQTSPLLHALPQAPQLAGSSLVCTHCPPQSVAPGHAFPPVPPVAPVAPTFPVPPVAPPPSPPRPPSLAPTPLIGPLSEPPQPTGSPNAVIAAKPSAPPSSFVRESFMVFSSSQSNVSRPPQGRQTRGPCLYTGRRPNLPFAARSKPGLAGLGTGSVGYQLRAILGRILDHKKQRAPHFRSGRELRADLKRRREG